MAKYTFSLSIEGEPFGGARGIQKEVSGVLHLTAAYNTSLDSEEVDRALLDLQKAVAAVPGLFLRLDEVDTQE